MAEKPDFVALFQRPPNTEIKHIRNNWYLYVSDEKQDLLSACGHSPCIFSRYENAS